MFYVQLLYFQLYSPKLLYTKPIMVTSNVYGECQNALLSFKFKPIIKCIMCKYKSNCQLFMTKILMWKMIPKKFLQGMKMPTILKTIPYTYKINCVK